MTLPFAGLIQVAPGTGASEEPGCPGGYGDYAASCGNSTSAGGGGAFATNGGKGGDVTGLLSGGNPGIASGTPALVPLRGGCPGGGADNYTREGQGGGAIQLASRTRIVVDGTIDASGEAGTNDTFDSQTLAQMISGGGAGGGILLEAPEVTLGGSARLLATGGDGGALCTIATSNCGVRGLGAHAGSAATAGESTPNVCGGSSQHTGGGGGGGLGRLRITTADGTYTKANTALEDGALTTATLLTR